MIVGVTITKIKKNKDVRGWLSEVFRNDQDAIRPAMCYVSHTDENFVRGPHEHVDQSDFFIFIGYGDFSLHLWDNRKASKTYGKSMQLVVGQSNPVNVFIPPGVAHGYKSITKGGSLSINLPDRLYRGIGKKDSVDEIRHENNPDSPFWIGD